MRFLWHQFHDDLTGTTIPEAYGFSWNDEPASANQFAAVLQRRGRGRRAHARHARRRRRRSSSTTRFDARRDPVEATVRFAGAATSSVRVQGLPAGGPRAARRSGSEGPIVVPRRHAAGGLRGVRRAADRPWRARPRLKTPRLVDSGSSLENARYRVRIDANGDIASVIDKDAGRELLAAPIRLQLRDEPSPDKPAWRILWDTVKSAPRELVAAPAVRVVERGPARVALEVTRQAAGSTCAAVSLVDGGDRVEVENQIDWRSRTRCSRRRSRSPRRTRRPPTTSASGRSSAAQQARPLRGARAEWADLTDATGAFGAAMLNDSRYGWDKPDDNVLRLTLLHTPLPRASAYQRSQDIGSHRFVYSVAVHAGDGAAAAYRAARPRSTSGSSAFRRFRAAGTLGRAFSLRDARARRTIRVAVVTLKKAEDSDELVVRLQERHGRPARARLRFAGAVASAREINAAEEPVGAFPVAGNGVAVELAAYQPRTLAVRLRPPAGPRRDRARPFRSISPFNLDGISTDAVRADGDFDGKTHTLAAELLPKDLVLDGVPFRFGPAAPGALNVVVPRGQRLTLPASGTRLTIVAAAVGGDVPATFTITNNAGGRVASATVTVREWEGPVGRWFTPLEDTHLFREATRRQCAASRGRRMPFRPSWSSAPTRPARRVASTGSARLRET